MSGEIFQYTLLGIGMVCFLLTGVVLIRKGNRKKDKGMIYLGGAFLIMILHMVIWGFHLGSYVLIYTLQFLVYMGINLFTRNAFYSNRKNNFRVISIATIVTFVLLLIPKILYEMEIATDFHDSLFWSYMDNILSIIGSAFVFGWLALSAYNSLQQLKQSNIQPWVISRIKIVLNSSVAVIFINFPDLINVMTGSIISDVMNYLQIFIILFFMLTQYLAWVMPPFFKDYLNRNFDASKEDESVLTDDEIMKVMEGKET